MSNIKEPKKEDYGYEEPSYQSEGGWMIEGGEEAYELAVIQYYKDMAIDDCKNIIQNADDVLSRPMVFSEMSKHGHFYTSELNTRNAWERWKREAQDKLKTLQ